MKWHGFHTSRLDIFELFGIQKEKTMDISKINKYASLFLQAAKKKKKKRDLKPAADSMMKGKKHPWEACMRKMKDKVDNPEAFCAKMKDLHKGTTEWRSTEGLKNKKKDKKDNND